MPSLGAQLAYDTHIAEALRLIDEKKRIEVLISKWCDDDSIKYKVDAFSSIKGISKTAAFCLISEIGEFSRFSKGSGFSSYLGLVPSENSSGKVISRGGITRTGNNHVRKTLIESAWCYARMKTPHKTTPIGISPKISAMARKANTRLFDKRQKMAKCKRPCVVNAAIARELACCVWTIGVAVESEGSV
jgi:transposase